LLMSVVLFVRWCFLCGGAFCAVVPFFGCCRSCLFVSVVLVVQWCLFLVGVDGAFCAVVPLVLMVPFLSWCQCQANLFGTRLSLFVQMGDTYRFSWCICFQ